MKDKSEESLRLLDNAILRIFISLLVYYLNYYSL